ncbi:MAG: hypothetical protein GX200_05390 [Firmicutes bacterium]|nr:hypothetical protein [Bacillota bacterium]
MGDKTIEQLLGELAEVQKMLEERTAVHGQMLRKFQFLVANAGLFSQIIDFFPYPIAVFTPQYTLAMVNKAFAAETKTPLQNFKKGAIRILQYKIDDAQLAAAFTKVFSGDTFYLEEVKNPFSMFSGISQQSAPHAGRFSRAVVFPVPVNDVEITHGVIVFMP